MKKERYKGNMSMMRRREELRNGKKRKEKTGNGERSIVVTQKWKER